MDENSLIILDWSHSSFKLARKALKLTKEEVAKNIGCSYYLIAVSELVNGNYPIKKCLTAYYNQEFINRNMTYRFNSIYTDYRFDKVIKQIDKKE